MKKLLLLLILLPNYCFADISDEANRPRKVVDAQCYTNCAVQGNSSMVCDEECSHYEDSQ